MTETKPIDFERGGTTFTLWLAHKGRTAGYGEESMQMSHFAVEADLAAAGYVPLSRALAAETELAKLAVLAGENAELKEQLDNYRMWKDHYGDILGMHLKVAEPHEGDERRRMKNTYPDCPPLGSDVAELTAFAVHLGLIAGCVRDGHTRACAERLVWFDAHECCCDAGEFKKAGADER